MGRSRFGTGLSPGEFFRRVADMPLHRAPSRSQAEREPPFRPPPPAPLTPAEAALRRAVLADPEADAPRLAYADWLDGQGRHERAELIRVQLALWADPDRADLLGREADLIARRAGEWTRFLEPWGAVEPAFRRGFVERLTVTGRCFLGLRHGLLASAPVREVRLVAVAPLMAEFAAAADLYQLRSLDMAGNRLGPAGLRQLLAARGAGGLAGLGLRGNDLGAEGLGVLSRGRYESLDLADNGLDVRPVERLLESPGLAGLRSLDVSRNRLAEVPLPDGLTDLAASACGLGPAALARLPAGLRSLRLRCSRVGPREAEPFARLTACRNLDLAGNPLTDAGLGPLEGLPLTRLDLTNTRITEGGLLRLLRSLPAGRLVDLRAGWNGLGPSAAAAAADTPAGRGLRTLEL